MPTTETNFTLPYYRTCILFFIFIIFVYFLIFFIFPFSVQLFFVLFVGLISLCDWFSLFSLPYYILIFFHFTHIPITHYSWSFTFSLFIQTTYFLSYYCYSKSHTAHFLGLNPFCHLPELYYGVVNFIFSHIMPCSHPYTHCFCSISPHISSLLS